MDYDRSQGQPVGNLNRTKHRCGAVAQGRQECLPHVKVGIVWQGNPKLPGDMYRSIKLAQPGRGAGAGTGAGAPRANGGAGGAARAPDAHGVIRSLTVAARQLLLVSRV
jgi:hypothetical protein